MLFLLQVVQVCAEHKKPKKLLKHMESIRKRAAGQRNPPRTLVFANRVKTARFVAHTLEGADFRVALLHGDRSQSEREVALLSVSFPRKPIAGIQANHGAF